MQLSPSAAIFSKQPFNYLQAMDLWYKIELKLSGEDGFCWIALKTSNAPVMEKIGVIKDMATDNFNMVADAIGVKLTNQILNFK